MVIIVCGVSGAGKTRLGRALAAELGWDFADADDYYSASNVAKMRAGTPLAEADRGPWLAALRVEIARRLLLDRPLVLACSALRRAHRERLAGGEGERVRLVFLDGPRELIAERLAGRSGHYMPAALLGSQLAALEPPEGALSISIADTTEAQVAAARAGLGI